MGESYPKEKVVIIKILGSVLSLSGAVLRGALRHVETKQGIGPLPGCGSSEKDCMVFSVTVLITNTSTRVLTVIHSLKGKKSSDIHSVLLVLSLLLLGEY